VPEKSGLRRAGVQHQVVTARYFVVKICIDSRTWAPADEIDQRLRARRPGGNWGAM